MDESKSRLEPARGTAGLKYVHWLGEGGGTVTAADAGTLVPRLENSFSEPEPAPAAVTSAPRPRAGRCREKSVAATHNLPLSQPPLLLLALDGDGSAID